MLGCSFLGSTRLFLGVKDTAALGPEVRGVVRPPCIPKTSSHQATLGDDAAYLHPWLLAEAQALADVGEQRLSETALALPLHRFQRLSPSL